MAKAKGEDSKKHGDKMEPLIDRTGRSSSPNDPDEAANRDPEALRDDDDEDVQNDDAEDQRDVGERD